MKILVVTPTFLPIIGGAELGVYEIYQRLGKYHNVRILTPRHPDHVISSQGTSDVYFKKMNFEVCRFNDNLNLAKLRIPKFIKTLLPLFSFSYITAIFKQIRCFRPDIINFHYIVPGSLALKLVKKYTKIPIALSLVSRMDVLGNETPFLIKHYLRWVIKSASCVIPISEFLIRCTPENERANIIPYGVDTERFSPEVNGESLKERLGIDTNKLILFALQRLRKVKRVDILIKSMPHILKANKNAILIIGGQGTEESTLRDLAKGLNVEKSIIFTKYIPEKELPMYFAMADIFVFHSMFETFGIILAQAMASGKPIVSVKSTSIPEVVDDGLTGILVEPLKPEQFAAAVIKLSEDKALMEEYSKNGRKKAVENFSWDTIAQKHEQIFKKLISSKSEI